MPSVKEYGVIMKKSGMRILSMYFLGALATVFAGGIRAQETQVAVSTQAQTEQTAQTPEVQEPVERKVDPAKLAALKQKIEQLKYEKLKTNLGMTDGQANQFFAVYKPAEQDIQGLVQQRNAEVLKLHQISNGADNNADVDATLTDIHDLTQQIEGRQQSLDQSLKPILSPRQRAQLLVFEQEFNHRVVEAIRKHRVARKLGEVRRKLQELRKQRQKLRKQLQKE